MKSVRDAQVSGKRVIVWTDLDVPIEDEKVLDDTRLQTVAQTLNLLKSKNASILMIGHAGRPKGKDPDLSLKPVAKSMGDILGSEVELLEAITSPKTGLTMLENIRFWFGEEANDQDFAREIAALGEIYVNDCFSTSHHAGATMLYLPKFLPSFVGINLEKEIEELSKIILNPKRPLIAIIGGAKLETKLPAINNLAKVADKVLVGGKLMFEISAEPLRPNVIVAADDVERKDIGPLSVKKFSNEISQAETIVWNGPMGVYEEEKFAVGTNEVAKSVVGSNAYSVVGGGDTIGALNGLGVLDKINYVSNGGGAMLEFLAGKKLPGLESLGETNEK